MPGMDRTGPYGTGPVGRGLGPCSGGGWTGFGRTNRARRSGGAGWRVMQAGVPNEKETLELRKNWLESQLSLINQRLQELTGNKEAE